MIFTLNNTDVKYFADSDVSFMSLQKTRTSGDVGMLCHMIIGALSIFV